VVKLLIQIFKFIAKYYGLFNVASVGQTKIPNLCLTSL